MSFNSTTSFASSRLSWDKTVLSVGDNKTLTADELAQLLAKYDTVVLSEKHYTKEVQVAEGQIINDVVLAGAFQSNFTFGWEFLNASDQVTIDKLTSDLKAGKISAEDFVVATQGSNGVVYSPVIQAVAKFDGAILGLNLSRAEKSPVTSGGLSAADPKLVPAGYVEGNADYRERFEQVMSAHVPASKLNNYWDAQCLTDDVMAYSYLSNKKGSIGFLVMGSFHAEYFDGTVERLMSRKPSDTIVVVQIVDASDYTVDELSQLANDSKYGAIANYLYFVNEPVKAQF